MSVIVNGMKMPDCCGSCPLLEYDDYATGKEHHCNALNVAMSWDDLPEGRRKDCPLTELIRCKDCIYFTPEKSGEHWNVCRFYDAPKTADGYCNDAERKEE